MTEEYKDGNLEYSVIEALIEEIVDKYNLKVYVYMECDRYDNALSTTILPDEAPEVDRDDVQLDALTYLVADVIKDKPIDERNTAIASIVDAVYDGIHIDDEPEVDDDEDDDEDEEE